MFAFDVEHPIRRKEDDDKTMVSTVNYLTWESGANLKTWEQVAKRSPRDLMKHPGIGTIRMRRIMERLSELGILYPYQHPDDEGRCPCCGRKI